MTLTPSQYNFSAWKGTTFSKRLIRLTGDGNSPPEDLTGWSATLTLYDSTDHTTVLLTLTSGDGITLGTTEGTIDLFIPASTTGALDWRTAVYDLRMTQPDGTVEALLYGSFSVHGP